MNFLAATSKDARIRNYLSVGTREVHHSFHSLGGMLAAEPLNYRHWHTIPLPRFVRRLREARGARRWHADVVVNTNLFGNVRTIDAARGCKAAAIYWERGAAWFPYRKPLPDTFKHGHALLMANSRASAAMLSELWGMGGAEICAPCVWHDHSSASVPRVLPDSRRLRLGFAARLRAFKGCVLAVHALREIVLRGLDAELLIAGSGPDEDAVERVVLSTGMSGRVTMLGHVENMTAFYERIDLLLHPALREPYGNVCAEAACVGVPVVATNVDGLPEVVSHDSTGLCVTPELPLSDFTDFGGDVSDIYPIVYRPELGRVGEPRLPSPAALADAVMTIAGSPDTYLEFSRRAAAASRHRFCANHHIDRFVELIRAAVVRKRSGNQH